MALVANGSVTASKPRRVEGHTSNVEVPILYTQFFQITAGNSATDSTHLIPHKFKRVAHINLTPTDAAGSDFVLGDISDTTNGCYVSLSSIVSGPTQITTAATAGASSVVLTGLTASVDDAYNNCWLEITYANGNTQVVKITDFATTTALATLADPLAHSIDTTGSYYTIRGSVISSLSTSSTPGFSAEVLGYFE